MWIIITGFNTHSVDINEWWWWYLNDFFFSFIHWWWSLHVNDNNRLLFFSASWITHTHTFRLLWNKLRFFFSMKFDYRLTTTTTMIIITYGVDHQMAIPLTKTTTTLSVSGWLDGIICVFFYSPFYQRWQNGYLEREYINHFQS